MLAVLRFHLLQVSRSRLLVMWALFTLLVQYALVRILHAATIQYQANSASGQVTVDLSAVVMALVYSQFVCGIFLATVYGIWVAPYLHEENRAPLTFALPVDKAIFPGVYALSFFILYLLQAVAMFLSLTVQFGFSVWSDPLLSWTALGSGSLISILALEGVVFVLAVFSLVFGKVPAFLGGAALFMVLTVSGIVFRAQWVTSGIWKNIYKFLPPIGEVFTDIKSPLGESHWLLWLVWIGIFAVLFRVRLNRA
jgi:hypothetical protein